MTETDKPEALKIVLTYRYRIKDAASARQLEAWARKVNFVWNYCCEVQRHAQAWRQKWPSHFILTSLTAGSSRELGLHSNTIGEICRVFAIARYAKRHCPDWRSHKRSLPWVPFRGRDLRVTDDGVTYHSKVFRAWMSRKIDGRPLNGSFSRDARGRWYVNIVCEAEQIDAQGAGEVGIDLGLKSLAVLSTGEVIANPKHFARHAAALAVAQRAGNKRRAAAINAKIANVRRDFLHKQSTRIANTFQKIVVGDVSASRLMKTDMAKSVSDAGWLSFKEMLRYKAAIRRGAEYVEVSERFTTRTCAECGCIAGPKGQAGLNERVWVCSGCGVVHDRDVNAARNILGAACRPRVDGIAA